MSIFIPSSSSEELALIHEFCICIRLISAYQEMAFDGISHYTVFMKAFEYVSDIRFQIIYNFRKILSTNVGSGHLHNWQIQCHR